MIEPNNKISGQIYCESKIMRLISFDSEVNSERGIIIAM